MIVTLRRWCQPSRIVLRVKLHDDAENEVWVDLPELSEALHMHPDPLGTPRNPFHVFLIVVVVVNGAALMLGISTSVTLDRELITVYERVYGGLLFLAGSIVLVGMYWPWDPRDGLVLKRGGYTGLGAAVGIFAGATLYRFQIGGLLSASISGGFALICWRYAWRISQHIKAAIADSEENGEQG